MSANNKRNKINTNAVNKVKLFYSVACKTVAETKAEDTQSALNGVTKSAIMLFTKMIQQPETQKMVLREMLVASTSTSKLVIEAMETGYALVVGNLSGPAEANKMFDTLMASMTAMPLTTTENITIDSTEIENQTKINQLNEKIEGLKKQLNPPLYDVETMSMEDIKVIIAKPFGIFELMLGGSAEGTKMLNEFKLG